MMCIEALAVIIVANGTDEVISNTTFDEKKNR